MCRRSDTLRENRRCEPIFDEKGFPRGKTQNETGKAVEVSVFVPWGSLSTVSTPIIPLTMLLSKRYDFTATVKVLKVIFPKVRLYKTLRQASCRVRRFQ